MSDDLKLEPTENLNISAQVRLVHQDMKHRFDLVDQKLDSLRGEHNSLRDRTEERLERVEARVVELEAKLREKDATVRVIIGLASLPGLGAAIKAFLG